VRWALQINKARIFKEINLKLKKKSKIIFNPKGKHARFVKCAWRAFVFLF
jgi:hypothetical protein